jgi:hypothetical protein
MNARYLSVTMDNGVEVGCRLEELYLLPYPASSIHGLWTESGQHDYHTFKRLLHIKKYRIQIGVDKPKKNQQIPLFKGEEIKC